MDFDHAYADFKQYVDDAFVSRTEEGRAASLAQARAVMLGMKPEERVMFWSKITADFVSTDPEQIRYAKMCHAAFAQIILDVFGVPMGEPGIGVVPKIPAQFQKPAKS